MSEVQALQQSAASGQLTIITGAGTSVALADPVDPAKNWKQLIGSGLQAAKVKGKISDSQLNRWTEALQSNDMDELLATAEFVSAKLGGPAGILYIRWLEDTFENMKVKAGLERDAFHKIAQRAIPISTLNYDTLLEQATGLHGINYTDSTRTMSWARRQEKGIFHLHGIWNEPTSCILGIRDYEKAVQDATARSRTSNSKATARSEPIVLQTYREFILRDCGQMTIEGVRADMETAQRKFDLERLFVPLSIEAVPPEIADSDPERAEKIERWKKKYPEPVPFGVAFARRKNLALLALPGGGKTLLLKRLAVAYADKNRMSLSDDKLPNLDLIPVLIRCREWRDHIRKPIASILENLPEITGQPKLKGLASALQPLLKAGKVLC